MTSFVDKRILGLLPGLCLIIHVLCLFGVPSGAVAEEKWAFCIGVGNYRDPHIMDVPTAADDAVGIARALKEYGGFDHVIALTDDLDRKDPRYPTEKNIRLTFRRYAKMIKPRDWVLVSFSGHGATLPSGQSLLLPVDARLSRIYNTTVSLRSILGFIQNTGVRRSLLLLDACRERLGQRTKRMESGIFPDRYLRGDISAVFYATKKGSYSQDEDGSNHSVFSSFVIRGLQGEADRTYGGNQDGLVTLQELGAYVKEGVALQTVASGAQQRPYVRIFSSGAAGMVFASVGSIRIAGESTEGASAVRVKERPITAESEAQDREDLSVASVKPKTEPTPVRKAPRPEEPVSVSQEPAARPDKAEEIEKPATPTAEQETVAVGAPAPDLDEVTTAEKAKVEPVTTQQKSEEPSGETVTVGAPAPSIAQIGDAEKPPPSPPSAESHEKEVRASSDQETKEEVTTPERETAPEGETAPEEPVQEPDALQEPQSPVASPEKKGPDPKVALASASEPEQNMVDEKATVVEGAKRTKEAEVVAGGAPEETITVASIPKPKKIKPVYLREKSQDLTTEAVKSMLLKYNFYSTCWNYNGDFCNPEGDFENVFVENDNGTVTDKVTKLMWQKSGSSEPMSWQAARAYAKKINEEQFAGFSDWRLPTVEELASLMERSWQNDDLFIDSAFDSSQKYCWSADTKGVDRAWKSNFHLGFFLDFPITSENSVRLVRSIP